MARDIGQCFLSDAKEMGFGLAVKASSEGRFILHLHSRALSKLLREPAEAGIETKVIKDHGTQQLGKFAHVCDGFIDEMNAVCSALLGVIVAFGGEVGPNRG